VLRTAGKSFRLSARHITRHGKPGPGLSVTDGHFARSKEQETGIKADIIFCGTLRE
jgi:GMP synthase PP-ATPase subunit